MVKLGNKKNVFWEAFLIAAVIFILGLLIGIFVESDRLQQVNNYYSQAQVSLMDSLAMSNSISSVQECSSLINSSIDFADNIYSQALLLEKYEASGKITDIMKTAHAEYDLLRTILWQNLITIKSKCPNKFNFIIYLYNYNPTDLGQKAVQNAWSNVLFDLKQKEGDNLILVPIAVNSNLSSLNLLTGNFKVKSYPAVIINNNMTIYGIQSAGDIEKYLS